MFLMYLVDSSTSRGYIFSKLLFINRFPYFSRCDFRISRRTYLGVAYWKARSMLSVTSRSSSCYSPF